MSKPVEPLPSFESEFWPKDADNRVLEAKQVSCTGNHRFKETKKALEVRCDCGVGYTLAPGMSIKDGRIVI